MQGGKVAASPLEEKLRATLVEPDDLTIWRFAVLTRPIRDMTWNRHIVDYRIHDKIQRAKEDGSWDQYLTTFLRKTANGEIPFAAFLRPEGRELLLAIAEQLEKGGKRGLKP